jgi:hypothetical protein
MLLKNLRRKKICLKSGTKYGNGRTGTKVRWQRIPQFRSRISKGTSAHNRADIRNNQKVLKVIFAILNLIRSDTGNQCNFLKEEWYAHEN